MWSLAGDAVGYDKITVEAALDADSHVVSGTMTAELTAIPEDDPNIYLQMFVNSRCGVYFDDPAMVVDSAFIDGIAVAVPSDHCETDVALPRPSQSVGNEATVEVYFSAHFPDRWRRFGRAENRYLMECWLPVPAPREDGRWMVVDYSSIMAEPVSDMLEFDITLSVPPDFQVMSAGIVSDSMIGDSREFHIYLDGVADAALFVGAGFELDVRTLGEVSVKMYYPPGSEWLLDSAYEWTAVTMDYMSEHVLAYPFDELVLVIGGVFRGGLELPRMVWLPAPDPPAYPGLLLHAVLHEVVHQWFFGIVNSNQAEEPWMDEAVTEYFTIEIERDIYGSIGDYFDAFGMSVDIIDMSRAAAMPEFGLYPTNGRSADYFGMEYFTAVYRKGCILIQTLSRHFEPSADAFWQEYAERFKFSRATAADFYALADQYLPVDSEGSAEMLMGLLHAPDYSVTDITNEPIETTPTDSGESAEPTWTVTISVSASNPVSGFPLDLSVECADGSTFDTTIAPGRGLQRVRLSSDSPAVLAVVDPHYRFAIDRNLLNNSYALRIENGADVRLSSGLMYMVESLFSMLWGW
jgi:hypothetical protein